MTSTGRQAATVCRGSVSAPIYLRLRYWSFAFNTVESIMGSYWSSYPGSTDVAALAGAERNEAKEYDYIICGGEVE